MDRLLNAHQLAERLGVSYRTLKRYEREGAIPRVNLPGRAARYDYDDVLKALKSQPQRTQK
jgi:excisionase family DNA binding protein